ncbi:cyclic AMP-responsive element-binding protein 3-like protein 2 isoform X2 [Corticium candelabrum]|uniref:cyclic AMP-responsive element-binding protein 3-like protein 2 isoform X2 n=1 Tax=Corticium candelabrum TaxID=121492 RepID=UPI002E268530|nr:cyclic AMP-responsive element-binding protein 3-like protein 2 isoform X2 [Corticium candelabrum]
MDDSEFYFDLSDLFDTNPASDDDFHLLDLNTDLLSVLADADTEQFFDAQCNLPNDLLIRHNSVEHDHQYCTETRQGRKRKWEDTLDGSSNGVSVGRLVCRRDGTDLNGQRVCSDCQLADDLFSLGAECGDDAKGRRSSESGEDNGYCSMAVASSPSSVSDGDLSSEQAVTSHIQSQPVTPLPTTKPVVTRGLPLLAYLPIPRLSNNQPQKDLDASKPVELTEEEKEALKAEGLPIPTTWPLTKTEEKALRVVRRKLRNKMCAAVSRQRKKEYIATLEQKVENCTAENHSLQEKVNKLESQNRSLLSELQRVRNLISGSVQAAKRCRSTQTGTCLMVLVVCFAVLLPQWPVTSIVKGVVPSLGNEAFDYTTTAASGRTLKFDSDGDGSKSLLTSMYLAMLSYFVEDEYYVMEYQSDVHEAEAASSMYTLSKLVLTNTTETVHTDNVTLSDLISS